MKRPERFKKAIVRYIKSFDEEILIKEEVIVGYRFVNTPRKVDIVLYKNGRYLGIEAKLQEGEGTAYQKLSYTIEDCLRTPIPMIIVFAGKGIKEDMKAKLISSGIGIEVNFIEGNTPDEDYIEDKYSILKQRIYIELGLNWLTENQNA